MTNRILLLALVLPLVAFADERILEFHSDIRVQPDGWIEVTEHITVRAEGARIRRGIYRDLPTTYRDRYGNRHEVVYRPLAVMRNDLAEDFHFERRDNGVRTYFGSARRMLAEGVHRYIFRYRANRMLGFFADFDELYWSVTGLEWAFPIDRASATIALDLQGDPQIIDIAAFTGPLGSTGQDFVTRVDGPALISFDTTRKLVPHEGLTVAVSWPKGLVAEPGVLQRTVWLLSDNVNLIAGLAGLLGMLVYFVPLWRKYGRDPEQGLIVTRYEPPPNFSPASLRYIQQMYYDNKVLTAAIVNLAVKGYLRIENPGDLHALRKTDPGDNAPQLAVGEKELHAALFAEGSSLILDDEYHKRISAARSAHRRSLKRDYAGRYFKLNSLLSAPGLIIGLVAAVTALQIGVGPTPAVIVVIVLMVVTFFVFLMIMKRPTGPGRKLLDEILGFREYLEIAEKDEMNLRHPPEKTPHLFEKYLPFALAMGIEQKWAERFASILDDLRGPQDSGYHPSWYNGSWDSRDIGTNTSGIMSSLDSAISSSVTPPGSSSGSGGGGFSGGGGGGGGGGGW